MEKIVFDSDFKAFRVIIVTNRLRDSYDDKFQSLQNEKKTSHIKNQNQIGLKKKDKVQMTKNYDVYIISNLYLPLQNMEIEIKCKIYEKKQKFGIVSKSRLTQFSKLFKRFFSKTAHWIIFLGLIPHSPIF